LASSDGPAGAREQIPLAPLTTLGIGGAAKWFVRVTMPGDVAAVHEWCERTNQPMFVLGGGSNLVIADRGFNGVVVQPALAGRSFTDVGGGDTLVFAGAGEPWDALVAAAVERQLGGLESLSGIPGNVGGTPIQNVGAYGQEVAGSIETVTAFDRFDGTLRTLGAHECGFSYRMSRFKGADAGRFIICAVSFRLRQATPAPTYPDVVSYLDRAGIITPRVGDVRAAVIAIRRRKGMVLDAADPDSRSVGSFFMNPVVSADTPERLATVAGHVPSVFPVAGGRVKLPAAWLIERAGFERGHADGAVGISRKHTLALINRGGATADDVLRLATKIKRQVGERFGIWLQPEPNFVGFEADPRVDYLQRTDG
jgi:UDP-N-acetylmuramate dehydrogenase